MSFSNSSLPNYGGRAGDYNQYIKTFINSTSGVASSAVGWIFSVISGVTYITSFPTSYNVLVSSNLYVTDDLTVNGTIHNLSDLNKKDHIIDIAPESCMGILNLEPKEFVYKDDELQTRHFGFIAQDVEALFPNLVKEHPSLKKATPYLNQTQQKNNNESENTIIKQDPLDNLKLFVYSPSTMKTVNYIEFIPLILAQMKNMQKEIDQLRLRYS
jgi:hypothetical protein